VLGPKVLLIDLVVVPSSQVEGNQLDLYASVTGLSLFEAAIALCKQLDREIPLDARGKAEPGAR
jgi:hypothetical protein